MKTIIVNVTARDIKLGVPDKATGCPIFRAILRKRKDVSGVWLSSVIFSRGRAKLPATACEFIDCFDRGRAVKPFKFRLEIE